MRPMIEHLCIAVLLGSVWSVHALGQQTTPKGYVSLNFDAAKPMGEFNDKLSNKILMGFDVNGFITPLKKAASWETGLQLGMLFPGERKDDWNGLELTTSSFFMHFNLVSRFRPFKHRYTEPFFDISGGLNYSSMSSSYEIVDKATFFEKFFLDEEDEVVANSVKQFGQGSWNIGFGAGIMVNKTLVVQLRYNYSPEVEFVNKEDVTVVDGNVTYKSSKAMMETITLSVGLSLERIMMIAVRAPED